MKELTAAVIGVGAFGRHHARIYGELADQGVRLVGLVDTARDGTPRTMAERLGVPLVTRPEALPVRPDIVSVAVPTTVHREVAEPLLRQGVHCLVEKPLTGRPGDAQAIIAAAAQGGAHLQVGLVERFNPVLRALEALGEAPIYVEVRRLAPYVLRAADVGVVHDMMIHDLDILHHLVGQPVVHVDAVGARLASHHEDLVNARLTFASGCVANVTASRVADRRERQIHIYGRRASLFMDYDSRVARLVRPARRNRQWDAGIASLLEREPGLPRPELAEPALGDAVTVTRIPIPDDEPLRAEIECLITAARGTPAEQAVPGDAALRALELAERVLGALAAELPSAPGAI